MSYKRLGTIVKGARAVSCAQERSGRKSQSRATPIKRNPGFRGKGGQISRIQRGRIKRGEGKEESRLTVCKRLRATFSKAECGVVYLFFYHSLSVFLYSCYLLDIDR